MLFITPLCYVYNGYNGQIWTLLSTLVNSSLLMFAIVNSIRFGVFIIAFQINYMILFTGPIRNYGKRSFTKLHQQKNLCLVRKVYKSLDIFVYHLFEYVSLNSKAVQNFFTVFLLTLFSFNVINTAAIMTKSYSSVSLSFVVPILICTQLMAVFGGFNLIYTSDSLTCFALHIASLIPLLGLRKSKIDVRHWIKSLCLLEIVHNQKPFRFKFGNLGRISRRSFLSFAIVYSVQIMAFTINFSQVLKKSHFYEK